MSAVNEGSFEDAAARYVGLYKLGQAFKKPEQTVLADLVRNPVSFTTGRVVTPALFSVVTTERFSNIPNPIHCIYSLTQRLALYCTPGKARGVKMLKSSQNLLRKILPQLERLAERDPTTLSQILHLLARDVEQTAGDSIKVLNTWGTFVPLIQKLELLADAELVEPLRRNLSKNQELSQKAHEDRCYQLSEYGSGYLSAIGTAFANTAKRTANGAFAVGNQTTQLALRAQPLVTSGTLMAGSQLLQYKVGQFEAHTKGQVVNKVVDASTKMLISLTLQFFVVSRILTALSSTKPDEEMTYVQLTSQFIKTIYFPALFLCYAYGVHCWRKERLKPSQQVISEIAAAEQNKINLAKTVANVVQGVSGVSTESVQQFTTKAVALMNEHVQQSQQELIG